MRRVLSLLPLLAACTVPETLWLDMPIGAEAQAILFAARTPKLRVFAYPVEPGRAITLPFAVDGETRELEALAFQGSLESLGLAPGELEPEGPGTIGELPGRLGVFTALRAGPSFERWNGVDGPSGDVAGFPVPFAGEESDCGVLEGTILTIPTLETALFLLPLDDFVLLGAADGKLFRIREEGQIEEMAVDPPEVVVRSATRDDLGRLWFTSTASGAGSTLWSGTLGDQLALEPIAQANGTILRIAVSRSDPIDIVAVTRNGNWQRYDGTEFQVVRRSADPDASSKVADLAVIEPGHVAGIHTDFAQVFRYRDGEIEAELPSAMPDALRGIEQIDGLGLVVTSFGENVYVHDGTGWSFLGRTSIRFPPDDVVPIPSGFLIGNDFGAVEEYSLRSGFCPDGVLSAPGEATVMGAPFRGGVLFVTAYSRRNATNPLTAILVRRTPP